MENEKWLRDHDVMNAIAAARMDAIEHVLEVLIQTHPAPDLARGVWERIHLLTVDRAFEGPQTFPEYPAVLADRMARWSRAFRVATGDPT
ncbi:hypothetical protein EAH88_11755 [Rhodanobacter glycinis]|uniref:Uncharacterized protein n=1 Tax=Rhodanobacter glycinis TaxID=582702 RepID=A0A502C968_9GAMM|nr:hypothetical protein [Rhodanobacter glycinis]TPG08301.1 hypothetical protein EAH88_11755 [Rhodanobacter glycinis]